MQLLHSSLGLGRSAAAPRSAPRSSSSRSSRLTIAATARPLSSSGPGARKPQRGAEDRDVTASAVASRAPESAPANGKAATVPSTRCGDPPVPVAAAAAPPKSELTAEEIGKLDGVRW
jgi:hypothetical protein